MRFTRGTAMYTGGNIYIIIGETEDGRAIAIERILQSIADMVEDLK